jgi:hypothetical protein
MLLLAAVTFVLAVSSPGAAMDAHSIPVTPVVTRKPSADSISSAPVLWTRQTQWISNDTLNGAPLLIVGSGNLYVAQGDILQAVRVADGSVRWTRRIPSLWAVRASGGFVVGATQDRQLFGLDPRSGVTAWSRTMPEQGVYLAFAGSTLLYDKSAIDPRTGRTVWSAAAVDENEDPAYLQSQPLLANGAIYIWGQVGDGIITDVVVAIDASSGKKLWRADANALPAGFADGLAYMRNTWPEESPPFPGVHIDIVQARGGGKDQHITLAPDPSWNAAVDRQADIPITITQAHIFIYLNGRLYRYARRSPLASPPIRVTLGDSYLGTPRTDWFYFGSSEGLTLVDFAPHRVAELLIPIDGGQIGPMLLRDDRAYLGSSLGRLYSMNVDTHVIVMRSEPACSGLQELALHEHVLIALCGDERKPPTPGPCYALTKDQSYCPPPETRFKIVAFHEN